MDTTTNSVTFAGFLCADASFDVTHNRLNFRLANNRSEKACFVSVTAWNENATQFAGLQKGDAVKIVGRLRSSSWEQNGQTRYGMELVADKAPNAIKVISTKAEKALAAAAADNNKEKAPTKDATISLSRSIIDRLISREPRQEQLAKLAARSPIAEAFEAGAISGAQVDELTDWGKKTGDTWTFVAGKHLVNNETGETVENDQLTAVA